MNVFSIAVVENYKLTFLLSVRKFNSIGKFASLPTTNEPELAFYSSIHIVNLSILKKSAIILTVLTVVAMIFSSCRTTENCPAYGKIDVPAEQGVNS